jgi:hypothetical protein
MVKLLQVLYGYFIIASIILLTSRLLLKLDYTQISFLIILIFSFLRVRPHSTDQKYPFAFGIQPLFRK